MRDDIEQPARQASIDALQDLAVAVLLQARANTPVGDPKLDPDPAVSLAESGRIKRDGNGYIVIFDAPYAAKQHDDMRLDHPRGGGSKYLERALMDVMPRMEGAVASKVRARYASGVMSDNPARRHA